MMPQPLVILAISAGIFASGFGGGWLVNGWRLGEQIADLKTEQAEGKANQAEAALKDLAVAANKIQLAADGYAADTTALSAKLDALRKDFKNAKPLPVDCRPDDFRVRHLGAAIDAANQAAAGQ